MDRNVMNYASISFSSALVLFVVACGGGDSGNDSNTSGGTNTGTGVVDTTSDVMGGGRTCPVAGSTIVANEVNNYDFRSTLSFPSVTVAPDTELTFDWSQLTIDFLGHGMNVASDVDTVNLMLWNLTEAELETKLNADQLDSRDLAVIATLYTEDATTTGTLFEFTSVGMTIPPEDILPFVDAMGYPPDAHTYTIMAATGEELGQGTRMIQSFKLDPNSTNTQVTLTDTSTDLTYTVDLQTAEKTLIPAGQTDFTFDWTNMTVNGLGNEFVTTNITQIMVARFDESVTDLEAGFIDLVDYSGAVVGAADLYTGNVPAGTTAPLSTLMNENGEFFPGIDGNGTWVVGLFCTSCQNPAPWYLSILEACQ